LVLPTSWHIVIIDRKIRNSSMKIGRIIAMFTAQIVNLVAVRMFRVQKSDDFLLRYIIITVQ
jgi:hypothetical protein